MDNECGARPCKPAGHKRTPWWDESIIPEASLEQIARGDLVSPAARAMSSDGIVLDARTPEQWAASVEQTASENQRDIAKPQSQLDELRGWIQECNDGVSNLGMRLAKHEDMHTRLGGVLAAWMRATNAQLHRLLWGHPALEQQTTSERQAVTRLESTITQDAATGPREEG